MNPEFNFFGSKIKELREKHGFTVRQVAKQAGISPAYWSQVENGKRNIPKPVTLDKMAHGLREDREILYHLADYLPQATKTAENMIPIKPDDVINVPVIGTIKAGPNGVAFEDHQGTEIVMTNGLDISYEYFYLVVSGDSMIGDGIFDGDYALIKKTQNFRNGDICAVIVDGEEGTLKHVTRSDDSIVLTASNSKYPPRVFVGNKMNELLISGKLVRTMRMF